LVPKCVALHYRGTNIVKQQHDPAAGVSTFVCSSV
jgi:hypothetical protein